MIFPHLLETMRAEAGRIALWDRHLARLLASAAAVGYPADDQVIEQVLTASLAEAPPLASVRLTLGPAGEVAVRVRPLDDAPLRTAAVDPLPWRWAGTPRCVHKSTDRDLYRARARWAERQGADDAILVAPSGEVVEGTRTNVWVEQGGRLWTPPRSAGGLPGVYRGHILATRPEAGERALTVRDLETADAVYLSNALRGWMPVRLLGAP